MSDGRRRHTPALSGAKMARVILFDESLAPFLGEAITDLTNDYTWLEIGDPVTDIIDACYLAIDSFYQNVMIGSVQLFLGSVPAGWLALDGSTYDQSDYPELAAGLDTQYRDDVLGTFTLPDIDGLFPIGSGSIIALGATGGSESVTLTIDQIPAHTHTYIMPDPAVDIGSVGTPIPGVTTVTPNTPTGSSGGGQAHENRPPYLAFNYGIFAGRIPA